MFQPGLFASYWQAMWDGVDSCMPQTYHHHHHSPLKLLWALAPNLSHDRVEHLNVARCFVVRFVRFCWRPMFFAAFDAVVSSKTWNQHPQETGWSAPNNALQLIPAPHKEQYTRVCIGTCIGTPLVHTTPAATYRDVLMRVCSKPNLMQLKRYNHWNDPLEAQ